MILDTKSDLEALTLNAYHAADRVLMPVADWASLEEAAKAIAILERAKLGVDRARVVLTLVDLPHQASRAPGCTWSTGCSTRSSAAAGRATRRTSRAARASRC